MSVIKCKMCGGDLELIEGSSVAVCEYCGSQQTVPAADNEKKLTLFARANRLRLACEFDKAAGVYESIVADFPTEAEAYWGLVLCRYGIEYVDDPATGKKIPTCHRSSFDSVMEDSDFEQALENADAVARRVYRDEAKAIEELRRGIVEVSGKEPPYDIFICYKETAEDGQRTVDSVIAQDVYDALTEKSYRVFFSRISLEDKLGSEYEPYIFAALHSAKIMLAFGTDYEYYNAVWVKNEWSRYLQLMTKDKSKHLIPCYKGIDAYDMPKEFAKLQAQDMGKVGAMQDLLRGVDKIMGRDKAAPAPTDTGTAAASATVKSLLKRAEMFLEDGDWDSADEYCEKVLDIEPECAQAYMVLLLVEKKVPSIDALTMEINSLNCEKSYQKAKMFADSTLTVQLTALENRCKAHQQQLMLDQAAETENRKAFCSYNSPSLIACGDTHTVGLRMDGTVVACGGSWSSNDECNVSGWRNIVAVTCGLSRTVGLCSDGTVVACGDNGDGACNVSDWTDVAAIACNSNHTVGLRIDGTVLACGRNEDGQCNVSDWTYVVAIACGNKHTAGLRADGTVIACGNNKYGQCDVSDWTDVIAIACDDYHTVGLCANGTVLAKGDNEDGECDISDWSNIVAITCGGGYTVGLRSDGTVLACGWNTEGECNTSDWTNIAAVACYTIATVGLRSDGTVVACGDNGDGQCNTLDWINAVALACGYAHTVCLRADGTVVACGDKKYGRCNVSDWKLFDSFDDVVKRAAVYAENQRVWRERLRAEQVSAQKEEEERRKEEEERFRAKEEQRKAAAKKREAERKAEEEKRKAAAEKQRLDRIAALEAEKQQIETELPHIKGLFSGGKRRDMENRLAEIERELKKLAE